MALELPPDVVALKDGELQQLDKLMRDMLLTPAMTVANIVKHVLSNLLDELLIFQSLEKKMRDSSLTEEDLRDHLDSLVALRQRIAAEMEERRKRAASSGATAVPTTKATNSQHSQH